MVGLQNDYLLKACNLSSLLKGLANKVVAKGQSLNQAIELAQQIAAFPQKCMLADRRSAYNAAYSPTSLQNALNFEHHNGIPVVATESQLGAHMFINKKY